MEAEVSFRDQVTSAIWKGSIIMGLQTPFVNPLNRISVVGSHKGYSTFQAAREIISGRIDNPACPRWSLWNLHRGISGHLGKEVPRLAFKPFGAVILTPKTKELFPTSPAMQSLAFASSMSVLEMLVNPADTVRVRLQSGEPLGSLWPNPIKQLYAGSLGNGMRQFGTWGIFRFSGIHLDQFFAAHTTLDTKSFEGMAAKSAIQAILLTSIVYPAFERLKNELQLNPSLGKGSGSLYKAAFDGVIKRSGVVGFTHGLASKTLSNGVLVYGFNWLVENGKPKPLVKASSLQIGSLVFENSQVRISKITIDPNAKPVMHYNEHSRWVIPLHTGTLEKVNGRGDCIGQRSFTRGIPFRSPKTDQTNLHGNINRGVAPVSLLIVEIKN